MNLSGILKILNVKRKSEKYCDVIHQNYYVKSNQLKISQVRSKFVVEMKGASS